MSQGKKIQETLARRLRAAQGRVPADLIIRNVKYLDVFNLRWHEADVAIADGVCVGVECGLTSTREIDGSSKFLVPGFIDSHVHVESSMLVPSQFDQLVLARGTTTAICDPHELANVQGVRGLDYFLKAAMALNMDLRVMLSSCVPATQLETNGGGEIRADQLICRLSSPKALGLAEVMNMPGVLNEDPNVMEKLEAFQSMPIDGHSPLLKGKELSAYLSTGISSCHETSEIEEAREKLQKGMSIWIREGSVAKDLDALIPLLEVGTSTSIGFCTDDRNPLEIYRDGHIDYLIRRAIKAGVSPEVAFRSASWTPARHYGLDKGLDRIGAIAPGYRADYVMLDHIHDVAINQVLKGGVLVSELELAKETEGDFENSIKTSVPEAESLKGPDGRVNVIGILEGKIITEHLVASSDEPGIAKLSVLERYGKGSRPSNAYVRGFGERFKGAIASSVGHDSHNLIVVGSSTADMRLALATLIKSGGGFAVAQNGSVLSSLALPLGGLMAPVTAREMETSLKNVKNAARATGCELEEPFLQLAFLCLPVIPSLKLTDRGLVCVEKFDFIDVRAS